MNPDASHPTSATVPASAAASEQAGKRASLSPSRANAAANAASARDQPRSVNLIAKAAGLAREPVPTGGNRRPGTFACARD